MKDLIKDLQAEHKSGPRYPWHTLVVGFILATIGLSLVFAVFYAIKDTGIGSILTTIEGHTQSRRSTLGVVSYVLLLGFVVIIARPIMQIYLKKIPYRENKDSLLHRPVSWWVIILVLTLLILGPAIFFQLIEMFK